MKTIPQFYIQKHKYFLKVQVAELADAFPSGSTI